MYFSVCEQHQKKNSDMDWRRVKINDLSLWNVFETMVKEVE
jgi:hypothetical protein